MGAACDIGAAEQSAGAPVGRALRERIADDVRSLAGRVDALLVSDYGYGVVGAEVAEAVREVQAQGAIVVLDPRRDFDSFHGLSAFTPNLTELATATGRSVEDLSGSRALNHRFEINGGLRAEESRELLRSFFGSRR